MDTIVTDVPLSQREQAMQSILAARTPEAEPQQDDIPVVVEEPVVENDDEVTLVVDGTEMKAPREKVFEAGVRALQKESAADRRLLEASTKEKELKRREEELASMEQDLLSKREQEPDDVGREFADAIFTDPETVAKTVSTIARQVQNVSEKVARSEQVEVSRRQAEMDSVVKHYHGSYLDIASDPDMHHTMNRLMKDVAAEKPELSMTKVIDETAKRVYEKYGKTTEPAPDARKQAKENMPNPVKRASARVAPAPTEKPKTPSEIIDDMRKGRGPRAY